MADRPARLGQPGDRRPGGHGETGGRPHLPPGPRLRPMEAKLRASAPTSSGFRDERSPSRSRCRRAASSTRPCRCWPPPASRCSKTRKSRRKLIMPTNRADVRVVLVRATDVPTYVEARRRRPRRGGQGRADRAWRRQGLYQPLDLKIAKCRMSVAVRDGFDYAGRRAPGLAHPRGHQVHHHRARALRRQGRARRPDQALRLDGAGAADRSGRRHRRPGLHRQARSRPTSWSRSSRSWRSPRAWWSTRPR